jgi:hypothetical protein
VILAAIIADWIIGAVSGFLMLRGAGGVWQATLPHLETQTLLVSALAEKEQLISKCMCKILGCLRRVCH